MKTFLNVLYRRILYKIPFKFLLVLLAVCAVFIACFSSAENVEGLATIVASNSPRVGSYGYHQVIDLDGDYGTYCFKFKSFNPNTPLGGYGMTLGYNDTLTINNAYNYTFYNSWDTPFYVCIYARKDILYIYNNSNSAITVEYDLFKLNALLATDLPVMTSAECQQNYSLIPVSSIDQNYCTTNNLCPSSDIPVCPVGSGSISNVYINDILHVGAPFIYMNIPDEIDWDYAYTQGGTNMNIDVVGYNQDTEKIDGIITIQNYKPGSSDLSSLVSDIIPLFVPGLCIILLLYFIFRFIKKIF